MFKDAGAKVMKTVMERLIEAGPGLAAGIAVFVWGNANYDEQNYHHRP
jgi:hypothetical protein